MFRAEMEDEEGVEEVAEGEEGCEGWYLSFVTGGLVGWMDDGVVGGSGRVVVEGVVERMGEERRGKGREGGERGI